MYVDTIARMYVHRCCEHSVSQHGSHICSLHTNQCIFVITSNMSFDISVANSLISNILANTNKLQEILNQYDTIPVPQEYQQDELITLIDTSKWNTSDITSMYQMFSNYKSITHLISHYSTHPT